MGAQEEQPDPSLGDWIAIMTVIVCVFMANLDSGITGAMIREVQGSFGSGVEEGSWISTTYLIGDIIAAPVAVYFGTIFSPRLVFLVCTVASVLISVVCGSVHSLEYMLGARFLQGLASGFIRPISHYLILYMIPARLRQFPLFLSVCLTSVAPAIGAALGGWFATAYTWKTCFFIQAVPGSIMIGLLWMFLRSTPMNLKELRRADWMTMVTLTTGLSALIYILHEGNRLDWFNSPEIRTMTIGCVILLSLSALLYRTSRNPFLELKVLFRRNFLAANFASALVRVAIYANLLLMTLFLTRVQGYNSEQCGQVALWLGIPQVLIFPILLYLVKNFDTRLIVVSGGFVFMVACQLASRLDHFANNDFFFWTQAVAAIGQPLLLSPLTTIAYMGIDAKHASSASTLYNLIRTVGGALGVAFVGLLINTRQRLHFHRIAESLGNGNLYVQDHLENSARRLADHGMDPDRGALLSLKHLVDREAFTMAYADTYWVLSGVLVLTMIAVLFARRNRKSRVTIGGKLAGACVIGGRRFPLSDFSPGGFGFVLDTELLRFFSKGETYEQIRLEFADHQYVVDAVVAGTKLETIDGVTRVHAGMQFIHRHDAGVQALSREAKRRAPWQTV